MLTVPLFLLCQPVSSGEGFCGHHLQEGEYLIYFLPHFSHLSYIPLSGDHLVLARAAVH